MVVLEHAMGWVCSTIPSVAPPPTFDADEDDSRICSKYAEYEKQLLSLLQVPHQPATSAVEAPASTTDLAAVLEAHQRRRRWHDEDTASLQDDVVSNRDKYCAGPTLKEAVVRSVFFLHSQLDHGA